MAFNYRGRKQKKRDFRSLWVNRIGVAAKINGLSYSKMINGLKKAGCLINRKMLSELAIFDPAGFAAVAGAAKQALSS
jgi:large subunit ribosomal protein L20